MHRELVTVILHMGIFCTVIIISGEGVKLQICSYIPVHRYRCSMVTGVTGV